MAAVATGCLGRGASPPTSTCENTNRPEVAMAVRLGPPPTERAADCLARSQSAVFGIGAWGERPSRDALDQSDAPAVACAVADVCL